MGLEHTPGSRIIEGASVAGGLLLAVLTIAQGWSSLTILIGPVLPDRKCNSSETLPHMYELNPRYGTQFAGVNATEENCFRTRRLLERDELRRRPTLDAAGLPKPVAMAIHGKIFPDGLYFIAMGIGNPPRTYYLDIDTGSDLTWLSCDAPCVSCAQGPHAWYNPKAAKLVDCKADICQGVQTGEIRGCSVDDGARQCDYDIHYGDGSTSQGVLVHDKLAFLHPQGNIVAAKVVIGCAYDQEGSLKHSPSRTDGILGLGSAPVSIPSQLAQQGIVANVVGHCISAGDVGGGFFFLGNELVPLGMSWTTMLGKPNAFYYYVGLNKIKYGAAWLDIDPLLFSTSTGGVIFDSGSSYTYLISPAYKIFAAALETHLKGSVLRRDETDQSMPVCWRGPSRFRSVSEVAKYFAPAVLEFSSGSLFWSQSLLNLAPEGYLIVNAVGNVCLGIMDSGVIMPGGASTIIGDISMRGHLVVYDNTHFRVGWTPHSCISNP